ncbi:hypothetical protein [Amycolatopsis taiwanensis]|uniref:hypothetical protein n=1 Tax=Amycolatopsis taiwanensis TaxID=342230 RepID=UPI0012EBB8A6|nr:hypothetical protein [Amycolatopsis taiwanensis]
MDEIGVFGKRGRVAMPRPLRHGLATTALVLVVCGAVAAVSGYSLATERTPQAAGRALSGLIYPALIAVVVVAVGGWVWLRRVLLFRRPGRVCRLRRVRIQRGLLVRSWLETQESPRCWIPVFFEPELVTLPSPATARLHGKRLAAVEIDGVRLYPSGRLRTTQPLGRRGDNPALPDEHAPARARTAARWPRQLRVDSVLLVTAPIVGLFWVFLDDSGVFGWLGATAVTASVALWWAAIRGSDPS